MRAQNSRDLNRRFSNMKQRLTVKRNESLVISLRLYLTCGLFSDSGKSPFPQACLWRHT